MNTLQNLKKLKEAIDRKDFSHNTYELFCLIEDYDEIYDNLLNSRLAEMMENSYKISDIELFKNVIEHYEEYIRIYWFNSSEMFINSDNCNFFSKEQLDGYFYLFIFPYTLNCIDSEMYLNINTIRGRDYITKHDFISIQSECEDFIVSILERVRNFDDMYLNSILDTMELFKFCLKPEMNIPEFILIKLFGENGFKNKYMEIDPNEIIKKYKYIIEYKSFDAPMAMMSVMNKEELLNGYLDILCSELVGDVCSNYQEYKETKYTKNNTCALFSHNFSKENGSLNIENLKLFVNRFIELSDFTTNPEIVRNLLECLEFYRLDHLIDRTRLNKLFKTVLMELKLGSE